MSPLQLELQPMIQAGVAGFKCFLIHSGVEEFPHVTDCDLHTAMKQLQNTGSVLLVTGASSIRFVIIKRIKCNWNTFCFISSWSFMQRGMFSRHQRRMAVIVLLQHTIHHLSSTFISRSLCVKLKFMSGMGSLDKIKYIKLVFCIKTRIFLLENENKVTIIVCKVCWYAPNLCLHPFHLDPSQYSTFLQSRPDVMEVEAIRTVTELCLQYQ